MFRVSSSWPCVLALAACVPAGAHDTWVQPSSRLVRRGDVVHVDLLLGNHGNEHRDFKLAGKLSSLDGATLEVVAPSGRRTDLVPRLVDLGSSPREGFWSARFVTAEEGLHCVAHTREGRHGTTRTMKNAKAYFLVAESLDRPPPTAGFATPLGHPLELVPETDPVLEAGPKRDLVVRLLFRGQPLAGQRVAFVPRGATLRADFDPDYERTTDAEGRCTFTPAEGTPVLVVARRHATDDAGEGLDGATVSATLVGDVPQRPVRDAE